jgi:hypothetical protein
MLLPEMLGAGRTEFLIGFLVNLTGPLPLFFISVLKADKVLCFDTLLEVFILKGLRWHKNRAKCVLILRDFGCGVLGNERDSSLDFPGEVRLWLLKDVGISTPSSLRTQRMGGAEGGPFRPGRNLPECAKGRSRLRVNREEKRWQATALQERGWARTIKGQGITEVNACQG